MEISKEAVDLIIAWEVGGGDRSLARPQYDRIYTHPNWPGKNSGLTIGIGYDLRYEAEHMEGDWKARLDALPQPDAYARLRVYAGRLGSVEAVRATRDITIPWDDALTVFRIRRLPEYIAVARRAFPGVEAMHPHVWGALTSLVFNCWYGVKNKPLKAKAYGQIREAVSRCDVRGVAEGLREMKKYHNSVLPPKEARGLCNRREAEARLVMSALLSEVVDVPRATPSVP
ncbi:MAG: hypothetical protein HUU21_29310 [Polyangiaceae bacterium]|nr:hypothetical protein [Polyangiaceae bacterium]